MKPFALYVFISLCSLSVAAQGKVVLRFTASNGNADNVFSIPVEWKGAIPRTEESIQLEYFVPTKMLKGKYAKDIYEKVWYVSRLNWIKEKGKIIAELNLTGEK